MAAVVKESSTLDITIVDDQMFEYVYKINNPTQDLTLAQVKAVYQPLINANLLYSKNENPITTVARARTTKVVTTMNDLS